MFSKEQVLNISQSSVPCVLLIGPNPATVMVIEALQGLRHFLKLQESTILEYS